jgi:hypothetical protein
MPLLLVDNLSQARRWATNDVVTCSAILSGGVDMSANGISTCSCVESLSCNTTRDRKGKTLACRGLNVSWLMHRALLQSGAPLITDR